MQKIKRYSSVSIVLIVLCGIVALLSRLGEARGVLVPLFITNPANPASAGLSDILHGQIWRLVTPMFIHFGIMHFVFNMMWVWDLGKLIQAKKGASFYIVFVLVVASLSNLAQYLFTHTPYFGGMSGVVYGLFGYIWIRGRYDAKFSADLPKTTVNMMLIWFLLCWTGLLGPIANWAHTVGLLVGALWAYLGTRALPAMTAADRAPQNQRLEYLSMADMLLLEEQRRWVREHYLPEAEQKYESVEGKLSIIDAIVQENTGSQKLRQLKQMLALDTALADALVQDTGAQWAVLADDDDNRVPVLMKEGARMQVLAVNAISTLLQRGETIVVQQLFEDARLRLLQE
ncbi:rhomboid family intramembrane serine protease [Undibacterium sp.]|uniref:rhomboid family intramembrane serine protease n=1 Tax=Undibacterium sp. TaxID=1914977 RepID=UPI0025E2A851|nr:rhomboid family intramembrane serine protease [Undibacterium sp.]